MPRPAFHTANNRPTCKVINSSTGARIHPKGCKVRKIKQDGAGAKLHKWTKTGKVKRVIKVPANESHTMVKVKMNGFESRLMYDTGATTTSIGWGLGVRWGLVKIVSTAEKNPNAGDRLGPYPVVPLKEQDTTYAINASGVEVRKWVFKKQPLSVTIKDDTDGKDYTLNIEVDINLDPRNKNATKLLGVNAIRALKKEGVRFKV